ncbi:hypothetical protein GCM10009836_60930 [Pseudonocardia ailaonensis]|uniref:Metallophosphoesterase n=1 Tax=Pseudonocardia ailaonensis TaxID=367279 RepID=A0ABN2NKZ7_9PSEU
MRGHVRTRSGEPRRGVLVSDGRTVTTTAHDGSWSLEPTGPFVCVTRPAGFTCEDWFVLPSTEHDFVLDPVRDDVFPHRFVHISDTHLGAQVLISCADPSPTSAPPEQCRSVSEWHDRSPNHRSTRDDQRLLSHSHQKAHAIWPHLITARQGSREHLDAAFDRETASRPH